MSRMIRIADGNGMEKLIPEEKLPRAMETYRELRETAIKAGYSKEEAEKLFTLKVLKQDSTTKGNQ